MTIGRKLLLSFTSVAVLIAVITVITYFNFISVKNAYSDLIDRRISVLNDLIEVKAMAAQQSSVLRGYLLTEEQRFLTDLPAIQESLSTLLPTLDERTNRDSLKKGILQLQELNKQYKTNSDLVLELFKTNKQAALQKAVEEVIPVGREMRELSTQLAQEQKAVIEQAKQENEVAINHSIELVVIISIVAVVLAIVFGLVITRIISAPIRLVAGALQRVANGHLSSEKLQVKNRDEIGDLVQSTNQMEDNLRQVIIEVQQTAMLVASSSEELAASAQETSSSTQQITSSIMEIAASTQQITSNTKMVNESARLATNRSNEGKTKLEEAIKQMQTIQGTVDNLAENIKELNVRSYEIESIVGVISDIAGQTNLLALNAAIEAARAGEHGRGFAVVADEVRKLAEQSANSAKQITALIKNIQTQTHETAVAMEKGMEEVETGIGVIMETGKHFADINASVQTVTSQVSEVLAATQEMSSGTEQVSASSEEQMAAMEEVASSSESLSKIGEQLQLVVSRFKI
ncbi:methyl-accepting chemotaxis protein [Brevibacillus fulvus]|nr:HAMP domain-containing methyl-accepting chemotaxis protein [Brevibacillus fulvus]